MKHPHSAVVRILSLLLLLTLLPLPACAQGESALAYLADIELTDLQQLENVRTLLDQAGDVLYRDECALLVDAMLIMARDDIFQMGQGIPSRNLEQLRDDGEFAAAYSAQGALPSLADLAGYAKARRFDAYQLDERALELYRMHPVLDAPVRADALSGGVLKAQYDQALALLNEGAQESVAQAVEILEDMGDYHSQRLAEAQQLLDSFAASTSKPTAKPTEEPAAAPIAEQTAEPMEVTEEPKEEATAEAAAEPQVGVQTLLMGTGGTSGIYYAFGSEIAQLWTNNIKGIEVVPRVTGASKANIVSINDGAFQLGWSQNDTIFYAYTGDKDQFEGEVFDKFYAIAALYPEAVQLVVAADSDIKSIADLKGKKVSIGAQGSGTSVNALQILELAGLTLEDIEASWYSFAESATAFQNLQIDAAFITAGIPNPAIIEMSTKLPVRLIPLTDDEMKTLSEKYPFYIPVTVKKDTYTGMTEDTTIASTTAVIIASKDLDDDLVYNLTKTLFEKKDDMTHAKKDELDTAFAVQGLPCPIHPGAAKYYAEVGVEIPEASQVK
ncbi:MAG: TAXI family TRAP transporter solute-binding subunit [Christensenellales bacterium]|jgi:TRAP transporter TAXI family solute receptor